METLAFMLAQSFMLSGTITSTATDSLGAGRTITWNTGDNYYRIFLADTSVGDGSSCVLPFDLLLHSYAATSLWLPSLNADGTIRWTYTGTGTGTLHVPAALQPLLGLFGLGTLTLAAGAHYDGQQPTHCVFSLNWANDEGYKRVQPRTAAKRMVTGQVYGIGDRIIGATRKVTFQLHPKDFAAKANLEAMHPTDNFGTPMFPIASRMVGDPWDGEPSQGYAGQWSVVDTLGIAVDQSLGIAWGNLQDIIADDSSAPFDVCFFTPETLLTGGTTIPSSPNWDLRYDCQNVEFSLYQQDVFP
jgi:hypothetical protein